MLIIKDILFYSTGVFLLTVGFIFLENILFRDLSSLTSLETLAVIGFTVSLITGGYITLSKVRF